MWTTRENTHPQNLQNGDVHLYFVNEWFESPGTNATYGLLWSDRRKGKAGPDENTSTRVVKHNKHVCDACASTVVTHLSCHDVWVCETLRSAVVDEISAQHYGEVIPGLFCLEEPLESVPGTVPLVSNGQCRNYGTPNVETSSCRSPSHYDDLLFSRRVSGIN